MSNAPAIVTAAPAQREILRQALADAVYYRDPPLRCAACPSPERLCDQCAAGHERARAYLALSAELGLKAAVLSCATGSHSAEQRRTPLKKINGSSAPPCSEDCTDCYSGRRLHLLAQKLTNRGLDVRIVNSGVHDAGINVTNPGAPERGTFYAGSDGCLTWEHAGSLDDDGIGKIVDEAINALRANGMRLPRRQKPASDDRS